MSASDLNQQVTARTMIELDHLYNTLFTHINTATDLLLIPVEQIQACLTRDGNHRVYQHLARLAAHALHTAFGDLPNQQLDTALDRATDKLGTSIHAFGEDSWKLACELLRTAFDPDPATADLINNAPRQTSPAGTVTALLTLRAIPHYLHTDTPTQLTSIHQHQHMCPCGTFTCPTHQPPPIQPDCPITCLNLDPNTHRAILQGNPRTSIHAISQLLDTVNSNDGLDALRDFTGIGPTRAHQIATALRQAGLLGPQATSTDPGSETRT